MRNKSPGWVLIWSARDRPSYVSRRLERYVSFLAAVTRAAYAQAMWQGYTITVVEVRP